MSPLKYVENQQHHTRVVRFQFRQQKIIKMGRKKLTKLCTECENECERKQFARSMWEKEEEETGEQRLCRHCQFDLKKKKEQLALLALSNGANSSSAAVSGILLPIDFSLLSESFLSSPTGAPAGTSLAQPLEEEELLEPELFEGVDLDHVFEDGEDDDREKRSVRAKRRRAKMNSLFSALAMDVGLSEFADRARVLEKTREVLRDLREAKKLRTETSSTTKPIVSILDVISEHLLTAKDDIITHSPCA